jgi:hypothetical protein
MNAQPATASPEMKWSNHREQSRNRFPSRSWNGLSHKQKAQLCTLSRQAFTALYSRAPLDEGEAKHFRHEQVEHAIGRAGLRDCVQNDYLPLKAHFLDIIGESGAAMNAHLAHANEDRKLAHFKLERICEEKGVALGYAATICRAKFKCALEEASKNQLWKLFFTVKSRRSKKRASEEEPF